MYIKAMGGMLGLFLSTAPLTLLAGDSPGYEVWAADQNGNVLYVLAPDGEVKRAVNLAELSGADRPHTLYLDGDGEYMFFANTVSNQAAVLRVPTAELSGVVAEVGKAPHAVQPHRDDASRAYVSNIAPQARNEQDAPDRGETITEISRGEDGTWRATRHLDLRSDALLADDERFPSRRPVLVAYSADGRYMLVTLFHGGVAAVDLERWQVTRAWGTDRIHAHGTVLVSSPDGREIYVTAGAAESSWLYVFDVSGEPELVAAHDLSEWGFDAHGAAIDAARGELWLTHRASGTLTIHDLQSIRESGAPAAVLEMENETPDLIEISPDGRMAYVTLRGPNPAPTIPFPLQGNTPGVALVDVAERSLVSVVPLGDREQGDFHGIAIVRLAAGGD